MVGGEGAEGGINPVDAREPRRIQARLRQQLTALRARYKEFRNLPPGEQERLRQAYRRFNELPPAEREELRKRWQQLRDVSTQVPAPSAPGV